MFGRTKPRPTEEATIGGWLEKDVRFLASSFAKEHVLLPFEINGISHSTRFCGEAFSSAVRISRSNHDLYNEHSLAFNDPPASEDSHLLAVHEHELFGLTPYPRARMRCHFGAGNLDEIKEGNLGWLSVNGEKFGKDSDNYQPMIEARFNLQTSQQEVDLRRTIQAALFSRGSACINFILYPIEDADEWATRLMRDGYSTSLRIKAVYATTNVGRVLFE